MGFFLLDRIREARDRKIRIRRDWQAINKFAEEQGKKRTKVETVMAVIKSQFPDEYSKLSADDLSLRLDSKSVPELNELIVMCLNCLSFQDITSRL